MRAHRGDGSASWGWVAAMELVRPAIRQSSSREGPEPQQRQLFNYMRPGRRQHRTQGARLCVLQDDKSDAGLSAGDGGSVGKE